jgi:hypothetical protein
MTSRADDLAQRFAAMSEAFAAEMEQLSPAQWRAFVPEEQRTVAAMARHVGWAYRTEMAVFAAIAAGRPYEPLSDAGLAVVNAAHGDEFAECDQAETVAFLREQGAAIAAEIRALSNEELARTGVFLEELSEESVGDWIDYVLIGHPAMHLPAIRAAAASAADSR